MPVLLIALLNFTVNDLLILAAAGLCRQAPSLKRSLLAAGFGAAHILLCLLPGLGFLKHTLWHILTIPFMGYIAFGTNCCGIGTLLVLHLGVDAVLANRGLQGTLAGLCTLLLLWLLLRKHQPGKIPVLLQYRDKALSLTALWDTGNCLRDPITGGPVLVIGPKAAEKLTGLTSEQLCDPIATMGALPGLRLIPYKTVGGAGFLLGLQLPKVRIGQWQGSHIVAFAPMGLEGNRGYEALIGGRA